MSYSLLGINDPRLYLTGESPVQSFFSTFGQNVAGGMHSGMAQASELSRFGAQQRIAPYLERNAAQGLNTQQVQAQNQQLLALVAQQTAECHASGWQSPECKRHKALLLRQKQVQQDTQAASALGMTPAPASGIDMAAILRGDPPASGPTESGQENPPFYGVF